MKMFLKILLVVFILFVLIIAGGTFYITRGLDAGAKVEVAAVNVSGLEDGIYKGRYTAGRWTNEVNVTVKDHRITKIDIAEDVTFPRPEWTEQMIKKVLDRQNTDVDLISGATVTNKAYLKAIENALNK